jgi:hypothetical protein
MRILAALLLCLLVLPSPGRVLQNAEPDTQCRGVVHGLVTGQDRKPVSGIGVVLEPVGSYDYVLPRTKTDVHGEYRFEKVCPGKWGVFVQDEQAGYTHADRMMNGFLYGHDSPQVEITDKGFDARLNIDVPRKPGQMRVQAISTRPNGPLS